MIIAFLALAFSTTLFCQKNVNVAWSPKATYNQDFITPKIIGEDASGYYAYVEDIHYVKSELTLEKFDRNMKLLSTTKIKIPKIKKTKPLHVKLVYFENQLILMASIIKNQKHLVYVQKIDQHGKSIGSPKLVCTMDAYDPTHGGSLHFQHSKESSLLLLIGKEEFFQNGKKSNFKRYFVALDKNLNVSWEKTIELPFAKNKTKQYSYILAKDGSIWISFIHQTGKNRDGELILYQYKNGKIEKHKTGLQGKSVISSNTTINKYSNDVCISAIYGGKKKGDTKTLVHLVIDSISGKIKSKHTQILSKELITDARKNSDTKKQVKIEKGELSELDVRAFHPRKSGGGYLIAELIVFRMGGIGPQSTSSTYYGPVLIFNVLSDGKIDWVQQIDRYHIAGYGPSMSASLLSTLDADGEHLQLIMNHIKKKKVRETDVIQMTIDSKKGLQKKILFKNHQKSNHYMSLSLGNWYGKSYKNSEVIIYSNKRTGKVQNKGNYKFCRIRF